MIQAFVSVTLRRKDRVAPHGAWVAIRFGSRCSLCKHYPARDDSSSAASTTINNTRSIRLQIRRWHLKVPSEGCIDPILTEPKPLPTYHVANPRVAERRPGRPWRRRRAQVRHGRLPRARAPPPGRHAPHRRAGGAAVAQPEGGGRRRDGDCEVRPLHPMPFSILYFAFSRIHCIRLHLATTKSRTTARNSSTRQAPCSPRSGRRPPPSS